MDPETQGPEPIVLERPVMAENCASCGRLMVASRTTVRIDQDRKPVCCPCVCGPRWREWLERASPCR